MDSRLEKQLEFLKTADKLKQISRKTSILGGERKENSAEHSWHVMLTAMTIAEHSNESVDLCRVLQMLAVHDLGEMDGGDTFHYHKSSETDAVERQTVEKLFNMLPLDQATKFLELWNEFEVQSTAEARFAAAIDRLWPCIQNFTNRGGTWLEFKISLDRALDKNKHIADGSASLWDFVEKLLRNANEQNLMFKEPV